MADTTAAAVESTGSSKRKAESAPPEGYVCNLCGVSGHWIQQCTQKPKRRRKKKHSAHEPVPGVDPSQKDIEHAKQMQQLKQPKCDCGIPSRLKKVKKSKVTENSRANGSYFFFCSKRKEDPTKCKFAQPVEEQNKTDRERRTSNFFAKKRKKRSAAA